MPIQRSINKDFFKTWTFEMSYVLGLFAADGNLIKNKRGAHFFSLELCDRDILEKISAAMDSSHKIGIRKPTKESHQERYRLQIGSKEIFADLQSLGFRTNKTHNMSVPYIPDKYFGDFLRGYFDGDGNVWSGIAHKDRKKAAPALLIGFTSSSRSFLEGLYARLKEMEITKGGSFINYGTYYRISYATQDSLKIHSFMYNRERYEPLCLSRKKKVFDRFIANNRVAAVAQR